MIVDVFTDSRTVSIYVAVRNGVVLFWVQKEKPSDMAQALS